MLISICPLRRMTHTPGLLPLALVVSSIKLSTSNPRVLRITCSCDGANGGKAPDESQGVAVDRDKVGGSRGAHDVLGHANIPPSRVFQASNGAQNFGWCHSVPACKTCLQAL